jgi:hypothetical protein
MDITESNKKFAPASSGCRKRQQSGYCKAGTLLTSWGTDSFWMMTLLHRVNWLVSTQTVKIKKPFNHNLQPTPKKKKKMNKRTV